MSSKTSTPTDRVARDWYRRVARPFFVSSRGGGTPPQVSWTITCAPSVRVVPFKTSVVATPLSFRLLISGTQVVTKNYQIGPK